MLFPRSLFSQVRGCVCLCPSFPYTVLCQAYNSQFKKKKIEWKAPLGNLTPLGLIMATVDLRALAWQRDLCLWVFWMGYFCFGLRKGISSLYRNKTLQIIKSNFMLCIAHKRHTQDGVTCPGQQSKWRISWNPSVNCESNSHSYRAL